MASRCGHASSCDNARWPEYVSRLSDRSNRYPLNAIVKTLLAVTFLITAANPDIAVAMRRLINWLYRNERADGSDGVDHCSNALPRVGLSRSAAVGALHWGDFCVPVSEAQNSCSISEE